MIIEMLLTLIKNLLNLLLVFNIPKMPETAISYINDFFGYLETGASILSNYTPLSYLLILFGIVIAVDSAVLIYKFVMWILRKIPMLSMS